MSPEQVRGTAEADPRSDIYSVGAVLYELVTCKKPFDGDTAFSIMAAHVEESPTPPVEVEPNVPLPLNNAILKSLEKDPSRRFQCADQFRQALINIESPATVSRPVSRSLLHFWVMRAASAPAVGTLALTSLLLVGSSRPSAKPPAPEVVLLSPQQTGAVSIAPAALPAGSTLRPSNRGIDRPEISAVQST